MKLSLLLIYLLLASACAEGENQRVLPSSSSRPSGLSSDAEAGQQDSDTNQDSADTADEGNQENVDNDAVLTVTYVEVVAPIIQDACVGCHNGAGAAAFLPLDTQATLQAALGSDPDPVTNGFLGRVNDDVNPMPPGGDRIARDAILKLLNDWQANNFL
ncbi:hypothetical protein [Pseudobacteriovorax antillogorgiicola]|nr:hypothetical protein [Pseudobacteriovorax antillogorgiicola]